MKTGCTKTSGAFTLVEIVMALGIFAFAIVGVVFLLGTALESSAATQRDSALSAALTSSASVLRSYDNLAVPSTLYFDQQGSPITAANMAKAYYQFAIVATTSGVLTNLEIYSITVTAPYPSGNYVGSFLVGRPKK